ncbi:MAG TPA: MAPEG family protein [Hyphomonas sp.]|nr:MAPEG family protein [Hyphomonas sp.]HPE49592.1 MAPEG family protein [Hyphomonas sp.]
MTLPIIVLLVLALLMVQLFLQETSRLGFNLGAIVGPRDRLPEASVIAGRLDRAKNNMLEALPFFLGLSMLALTREGGAERALAGAEVFLLARVLFVPAYVSGLPWLRSLIWLAGNAGLLMMVASLFPVSG